MKKLKGKKYFSGRTEQIKSGIKRFIDAQKLFNHGRFRGAMYLSGYYIECKLKAQLMEIYNVWTLRELENKLIQRIGKPINTYTHNIEVLMKLTGIIMRMNSEIRRTYTMCNRWKTEWRYDPRDASEDECQSFLEAVEKLGKYIDQNI